MTANEPTAANRKVLAKLQEILDRDNPCNIHRTLSGKLKCRGPYVCCRGCPHRCLTGCTVLSPACKFYFCEQAWYSMTEEVRKQIRSLGAAYTGILMMRYDEHVLNRRPPYVW